MSEPRYLRVALEELAFGAGKMAVVSGPRQCGKTTLAKAILERRRTGSYRNWDDVVFRREWAKDPATCVPSRTGKRVPVLVLDEIHKDRRWKSRLKGLFDTLDEPCDILVTGSARLNVFRKGGDSLLGRYFHFRLHPFSLREMRQPVVPTPDAALEGLLRSPTRRSAEDEENLRALMRFGPFPEPLLAQNVRRARMWRRSRTELIIREDLRDLSRIPDLGRVEMMAALLPERVGSPFSLNALREDLEVSHDTAKRWLAFLKELFYVFEVKPYSNRIPRSLKKEGKVYLWDFAEVEDEAARFENLIAYHLLKACNAWTDTGEGEFELRYLRNKDKQEIDFLVLRDRQPWLPVEVKLHDRTPSSNWSRFANVLPCRRGVQVVLDSCFERHDFGSSELIVTGAAQFLRHLV